MRSFQKLNGWVLVMICVGCLSSSGLAQVAGPGGTATGIDRVQAAKDSALSWKKKALEQNDKALKAIDELGRELLESSFCMDYLEVESAGLVEDGFLSEAEKQQVLQIVESVRPELTKAHSWYEQAADETSAAIPPFKAGNELMAQEEYGLACGEYIKSYNQCYRSESSANAGRHRVKWYILPPLETALKIVQDR